MSYIGIATAGAELPVSKGWTVMVTLSYKVTGPIEYDNSDGSTVMYNLGETLLMVTWM